MKTPSQRLALPLVLLLASCSGQYTNTGTVSYQRPYATTTYTAPAYTPTQTSNNVRLVTCNNCGGTGTVTYAREKNETDYIDDVSRTALQNTLRGSYFYMKKKHPKQERSSNFVYENQRCSACNGTGKIQQSW